MPEISQEKFEALYPPNPPATPHELRMRANSGGARSLIHPLKPANVARLSTPPPSIIGPTSSRASRSSSISLKYGSSFDDSDSIINEEMDEHLFMQRAHNREREYSENEVFVQFNNHEQYFGYKRELSHR